MSPQEPVLSEREFLGLFLSCGGITEAALEFSNKPFPCCEARFMVFEPHKRRYNEVKENAGELSGLIPAVVFADSLIVLEPVVRALIGMPGKLAWLSVRPSVHGCGGIDFAVLGGHETLGVGALCICSLEVVPLRPTS